MSSHHQPIQLPPSPTNRLSKSSMGSNPARRWSKAVRWCEQPSVRTYVSQHQYELSAVHLMVKPIESSFVSSPAFQAGAFMLGDDMDTMTLLVMAINYLRERLGRYPDSDELFTLLSLDHLTPEFIVQAYLDSCVVGFDPHKSGDGDQSHL